MYKIVIWISMFLLYFSCNAPQTSRRAPSRQPPHGSFAYDLDFLKKHDSVLVLAADSGASLLIVSPKYQGKVFASTDGGLHGRSHGYINYKAFDPMAKTPLNDYNGENSLWLGPEGGKYSLFFPKDTAQEYRKRKVAPAFDKDRWQVISKDSASVVLQKDMQLNNYLGNSLMVSVKRKITILNKERRFAMLSLPMDSMVHSVGYLTENMLTNTGRVSWTEKTGVPCIYILDLFHTSPTVTIVLPFKRAEGTSLKAATTDYIGKIAPGRLKYGDSVLFFKGDAKSRGKVGINSQYARDVVGAYDDLNRELTIIKVDLDPSGQYLDEHLGTTHPVFSGDAVYALNDGLLADGSRLGPFYSIYSTSPAAFLKPGQTISHRQAVFHFMGPEKSLDAIARNLLGVSLKEIKKAIDPYPENGQTFGELSDPSQN